MIRVRMEVQGREQSEQRVQGTPESGVGAQPVERNAVLPPNPDPPCAANRHHGAGICTPGSTRHVSTQVWPAGASQLEAAGDQTAGLCPQLSGECPSACSTLCS